MRLLVIIVSMVVAAISAEDQDCDVLDVNDLPNCTDSINAALTARNRDPFNKCGCKCLDGIASRPSDLYYIKVLTADICNGYSDCLLTEEDETNCTNDIIKCQDDWVHCRDTIKCTLKREPCGDSCVDDNMVFCKGYGNFRNSCLSSLDQCKQQCNTNGRFMCKDLVNCIPGNKKCNGKNDCNDWSDEPPDKCKNLCIAANNFWCKDDNARSKCINQTLKCNGNDDCTDGSDEQGCPTTTPAPPTGSSPTPSEIREQQLDRVKTALANGSDSVNNSALANILRNLTTSMNDNNEDQYVHILRDLFNETNAKGGNFDNTLIERFITETDAVLAINNFVNKKLKVTKQNLENAGIVNITETKLDQYRKKLKELKSNKKGPLTRREIQDAINSVNAKKDNTEPPSGTPSGLDNATIAAISISVVAAAAIGGTALYCFVSRREQSVTAESQADDTASVASDGDVELGSEAPPSGDGDTADIPPGAEAAGTGPEDVATAAGGDKPSFLSRLFGYGAKRDSTSTQSSTTRRDSQGSADSYKSDESATSAMSTNSDKSAKSTKSEKSAKSNTSDKSSESA